MGLAIPELDVTSLHNRLSDFRSENRISLDSAPATRRYKGPHCPINPHEVAINSGRGSWEAPEEMLAITGLDGTFLHNRFTEFGSVTWASLGPMPATRRYNVCLRPISIHGVHHPSESPLLSLTILNSLAVSSTTAPLILNLSVRRRWA